VINQKFIISFFKELLEEVHSFEVYEKLQKKTEFQLIKDLIRLGIQKYIIFIQNTLQEELSLKRVCKIFTIKYLNLLSDLD
jgi:hypothetical protein